MQASDKDQAPQTAARFNPDFNSSDADDGIEDLYTEYKNGLSGDISAMAQSDYASARSADQREVQEHRATHLQRRATRVSSSTWENHLVQDIYHHRNSFWAKGIMGFAGVMDSHAMHIALHATNTFTRDLMGDVSGSYGTRYFDDLHNDTSTFSDAFDFVGADVGVQVLGEIGAGILGYGVSAAADVLPSVGRNVAGMFGHGGAANSIADEFGETIEDVPKRRVYLNSKFSRTGDLHMDITYRGYLEKVQSLDVSTPRDSAVFYSGENNRTKAEVFANETNRFTLEKTKGGQWLDQEKLFKWMPFGMARNVWVNLSRNYAASAMGETTAFTYGASTRGIFMSVERTTLLNNPAIRKINYMYYPWMSPECLSVYDIRPSILWRS